MPLRPLGWGGPWAAAGDSGPGFLCFCVWRGRKGLLLDLLTLVWVSVLEHFRGRGGARWSWEFAEVSEVRRRPANGGGGLRGCVLEPRGLSPRLPHSPPPPHTPLPRGSQADQAPVGSRPFAPRRPCDELGPLPEAYNRLLSFSAPIVGSAQ